jgi:hypothetical protein
VSTLEVVKFPLVVDRADLVRVKVRIILSVCNGCLLTPRAFPQFVEHSEILISLQITLIMLDGGVDANGFKRRFLPTGYDVPSGKAHELATYTLHYMTFELWHSPNAPICDVVQSREALRKQEWRFEGG